MMVGHLWVGDWGKWTLVQLDIPDGHHSSAVY